MATKSAAPHTATNTKAGKPAANRKAPRTLAGNTTPVHDVARESLLKQYEAAIALVHQNKFERAQDAFHKLLPSAPPDIAPSIRMYLNTCAAELAKKDAVFSNTEERYDYAISLLNQGQYQDAREHFEDIVKGNKGADYALYGLALLAAMTNNCPGCIEHLTEAIRLNPQNRLQARLDSDFEPVANDPDFNELLYPEA